MFNTRPSSLRSSSVRPSTRPSQNAVLFNIFGRKSTVVEEEATDPDSIVVAFQLKEDEAEYKKKMEADAIDFVHNFIFSRITCAKGISILLFISSALTYYSKATTEGPLSKHKLLLLPVLDLEFVMLCFVVYILTICEICAQKYNRAIIEETIYTMVALMMVLISTIIVITDAIHNEKTARIFSGMLALAGMIFQLFSCVMTILMYRPVPKAKRATLNEAKRRVSIKDPRASRASRLSRFSRTSKDFERERLSVKVTKL